MGSSISICNFYENYMKKRESIVVGSPMNIDHPPGIRNSNCNKNKRIWNNVHFHFKSKSKSNSEDKYEDEII